MRRGLTPEFEGVVHRYIIVREYEDGERHTMVSGFYDAQSECTRLVKDAIRAATKSRETSDLMNPSIWKRAHTVVDARVERAVIARKTVKEWDEREGGSV